MSTTEYYSAIKKNEITPFAGTWRDSEIITLSEASQTEKDKHHMMTHAWNLSYDTKNINKTETGSQTHEQTWGCQGGEGGKGSIEGVEFGVHRCKLLNVGWINNKVMLHSTGNYIQYPEINHNGNKNMKESICKTE